MSISTSPAVRTHRRRPTSVWALVVVLMFLGASAAGGGVAMLAGFTPPDRWLDRIPLVGNWVVPGLVLAVGFGAGSLITAYGVLRRPAWFWPATMDRITGHHWSWSAALLLGCGQVVWILLELIFLPEGSALQVVYGVAGAALVLLSLLPPVRRDLAAATRQARQRARVRR